MWVQGVSAKQAAIYRDECCKSQTCARRSRKFETRRANIARHFRLKGRSFAMLRKGLAGLAPAPSATAPPRLSARRADWKGRPADRPMPRGSLLQTGSWPSFRGAPTGGVSKDASFRIPSPHPSRCARLGTRAMFRSGAGSLQVALHVRGVSLAPCLSSRSSRIRASAVISASNNAP